MGFWGEINPIVNAYFKYIYRIKINYYVRQFQGIFAKRT